MSVSTAIAAKHAQAPSQMPWMASTFGDESIGADFGPTGPVLHFASDRAIYEEGDQARSFYKVVSGVVRTCRFLSDGRRQIDSFHVEGDVFGFEVGSAYRLSAEAVSECTLIAYRRRGVDAVAALDDRMARQFFYHAMTCLARSQEHSLLLGRGTAVQKIATFLLEMAERGSCEAVIDLPMSRQDIADYLGLTIETASRTLSHLERDSVIGLPTARRVVLKDRRVLRQMMA
jgi:CRP/FNR family transcriptional regulator, nitrogen fixation regulation protein